jgi:hypothetical protein
LTDRSWHLLPFEVATEISREQPFAPARRSSGGGGSSGGRQSGEAIDRPVGGVGSIHFKSLVLYVLSRESL